MKLDARLVCGCCTRSLLQEDHLFDMERRIQREGQFSQVGPTRFQGDYIMSDDPVLLGEELDRKFMMKDLYGLIDARIRRTGGPSRRDGAGETTAEEQCEKTCVSEQEGATRRHHEASQVRPPYTIWTSSQASPAPTLPSPFEGEGRGEGAFSGCMGEPKIHES